MASQLLPAGWLAMAHFHCRLLQLQPRTAGSWQAQDTSQYPQPLPGLAARPPSATGTW